MIKTQVLAVFEEVTLLPELKGENPSETPACAS
jgi:hypothetical protein